MDLLHNLLHRPVGHQREAHCHKNTGCRLRRQPAPSSGLNTAERSTAPTEIEPVTLEEGVGFTAVMNTSSDMGPDAYDAA